MAIPDIECKYYSLTYFIASPVLTGYSANLLLGGGAHMHFVDVARCSYISRVHMNLAFKAQWYSA